MCMCALDLLRVGRHVALQQAWSSEQAVERRELRSWSAVCAFARVARAVAVSSAAVCARGFLRGCA